MYVLFLGRFKFGNKSFWKSSQKWNCSVVICYIFSRVSSTYQLRKQSSLQFFHAWPSPEVSSALLHLAKTIWKSNLSLVQRRWQQTNRRFSYSNFLISIVLVFDFSPIVIAKTLGWKYVNFRNFLVDFFLLFAEFN